MTSINIQTETSTAQFQYLLKPTYTWPNVPRPISFPFFHRDPGLGGFSVLPGLRDIGLVGVELFGKKVELLEMLNGGSGNLWVCFFFPSACRLVGDSGVTPPAFECNGETLPLCTLELGPGLVILGLGIGEHSGLPRLGCQKNWASISPPTELCPDV